MNKTEGISHLSGSYFETGMDDADLSKLINRAISVFQDNPHFDDDQIIDTIKQYRNDEELALALYIFIPIAYCRLIVPEPEYSDEYVLFKSEDEKQSFSFSCDRIYNSVLKACRERWAKEASQEKVVPILIHSADFKAINDALNDGAELKNLICSPACILYGM